jgi:hypothetical protein
MINWCIHRAKSLSMSNWWIHQAKRVFGAFGQKAGVGQTRNIVARGTCLKLNETTAKPADALVPSAAFEIKNNDKGNSHLKLSNDLTKHCNRQMASVAFVLMLLFHSNQSMMIK